MGPGALRDALNHGRIDAGRPRRPLASLPQPKAADGRLVLAVDVSNWLRPDAPCSAERLFCHTHGRSRDQHLMIPGWPYSFVAALESGHTSWCQLLDAVRLGPQDDVAEVTAVQVRRVVEDLVAGSQWCDGDADILIVFDAGYDAPRMTHLLTRRCASPSPCRGSRRRRADGPRSTARRSASPNRSPGASPTRPPCRSSTATAPRRRWPGTGSTPGSPPARPGSAATANSPSSRVR
ncbi:transposase [Streptomyces sp. NPDC052236]|uniref:transposase n=1 Tax=Streptomyces sp. NPDC052236 TaxID=3365686 RepID=UPI0037D2690D